MNPNTQKKSNTTIMWYNVARKVAIIAGVFAIILSILLIANYFQTKASDPLNSPAVDQLLQKLDENPNDATLKEQIRALDLLSRRAYFTTQWQIRTGGFLLFGAVVILLSALKTMSSLRKSVPDPSEFASIDDSWETILLSRKYIIYGGLAIFMLALTLGLLSHSELTKVTLSDTFADTTANGKAIDEFPSLEEIKQNWPSFRGPGGNGIAFHANVPTDWDGKSGKNILWKTAIPVPGYNSPIYWNGRIFLSGADKNVKEVYCLDAETGQIIWQKQVRDFPNSPTELPKVTVDTGYAAPTMTTDGKRVFAIFATGDLVCFDFDGSMIWGKNIGVPDNHYGHSSSLIMHKNLLLVQFDHGGGGHLLAFKAATGELAWDTKRDVKISWSSPILVNTGNRMEIILNATPYVASYNPETGQELWRIKGMSGEVAPSPAYAEGMVFAVNEYAILLGIQLGDTAHLAWEFDEDLSEVPSPVANKDLLIMPTSYGVLTCFDTKTGAKYWSHEFDEEVYSSPILVGDLVYLLDMKGVMHIIEADKKFKLVSEPDLGERSTYTPAFVDGRIFIRGDKHLYCIGKSNG